MNNIPKLPKKPLGNSQADNSQEPIEEKASLPLRPKLPLKPLMNDEVYDDKSQTSFETLTEPVVPSTLPKLPSRPKTAPEVATEPYTSTTETESNAPEVIHNDETGEQFDATTGYKINPQNGLVIVPDLEDVQLPFPKIPSNPRTIPNVDSEVDTVVIGDKIRDFGEQRVELPETIDVSDWTDDTSDDPTIGLGAEKEANAPSKKKRLGTRFTITDRDIIMMKFMARYRYAYVDQLARLVNGDVKDVKKRLKKLESEGLVRSESITRGQDIFLTRKNGNLILDIDFNEIKKGEVSFVTLAHTIGVANLGVEFEMATGGKNLLGEDDFPKYNRYYMGVRDPYSEPTQLGEMTVTEREIRRGNRLFRGDKSTEDMRYLAEAAVADRSAPELLEGNEGLFVVYGTGKDGEHVPDLVIARPRGENGEVKHIAIELEITPKSNNEWHRILRWYREHGFMYEKIYYFTHKRTLADAIKKAAEHTNMEEKVIIRKYIPQNNRGPFWG